MRSTRPSTRVVFTSPTTSTTVQHELPNSSIGLRGSAWEGGGSGDKDSEYAKRQGKCTQVSRARPILLFAAKRAPATQHPPSTSPGAGVDCACEIEP
jgi:hypothetical protein